MLQRQQRLRKFKKGERPPMLFGVANNKNSGSGTREETFLFEQYQDTLSEMESEDNDRRRENQDMEDTDRGRMQRRQNWRSLAAAQLQPHDALAASEVKRHVHLVPLEVVGPRREALAAPRARREWAQTDGRRRHAQVVDERASARRRSDGEAHDFHNGFSPRLQPHSFSSCRWNPATTPLRPVVDPHHEHDHERHSLKGEASARGS